MEGSWRLLSSHFDVCLQKINPSSWSKRTARIVYAVLFTMVLPMYLYIGFQPIATAEASNYPVLEIPGINLSTPVQGLSLQDRKLIAPADIAGSYSQAENKIFIIGHSSTVFKKLENIKVNYTFEYDNKTYRVTNLATLEKANIDMREILAPAEEETIIIMTCAGTPLPDQDATHRLIVTAVKE